MPFQIDLDALVAESEKQPCPKPIGAYQRLLAQIEPAFLHCLLEFTHSNKSHAARLAGINISTLERKLNLYGIVVHKIVRQQTSANTATQVLTSKENPNECY